MPRWTVRTDYRPRLRKIVLDRPEAAQVLQIRKIDVPVVDFVVALAQQIADHVLTRPFRTPGGRDRDKIHCGGQLRVETGVDGVEDSLPDIDGVHWVAVPLCRLCKNARQRRHQITSDHDLQAFLAARRIVGGSLQCGRKFARPRRYAMPGNRNILYLIIGALVVVVAVLGYNVYQAKKQPEGLQINLGPNGLKIENK
jgi:hypothetical protein